VKLILRTDIPNLGRRGEVVRVASGYGRNYLLPKKLAYPATPGAQKQVQLESRAVTLREAQDLKDARALADRIGSLGALQFTKKAGEGETLYGSVTTSEIAEALAARGIEIDRRKIHVASPIKKLGTHQVELHLFQDVTADLAVDVVAEE
jgi:large subunit ribosomal protein L9